MTGFVALVVLFGLALVAFLVMLFVIRNLLYVCQPNEVLVFSGTTRQSSVGIVGYRIIKGGRAIRKPIIEAVDRIDLTNMIIEVSVTNAYSKGGIPLSVNGVANIKIPGELPLLHNALERFLGRSRQEVMQVARETLEGNLRGVLATLTPEQVNQDKEAFAGKLTEEAEHDLNRIGLVLDTLKIQNVSDDVGYLNAIGRMRSAHIRRDAAIAEAAAQAQASEVKWTSQMRGEVSKLETAIEIARKENDRRIADARTRRQAVIAEQLAAVQETAATVDEITHAGSQVTKRAQEVIASAQATSQTSIDGLRAVDETARSMDSIREQAELVAQNIVALSEKTQAICDIILSVNDISERSHLLALNAAIEAAAAGESGRSFSVVASEMKVLADQAKDATNQVRAILGDVQRGINTSVMLTEEAVKRASAGKQRTEISQRTIGEITHRFQESVQTFQQIVASTNQQQLGIEQVMGALQNIRQASQQTAAGTRQLNDAAGNLNGLSEQLLALSGRYKI